MAVLFLTADGKKIYRIPFTQNLLPGANNVNIVVSDAEAVSNVLHLSIDNTQPNSVVSVYGQSITGNVVGLTLNAGVGTTLTGALDVIGQP